MAAHPPPRDEPALCDATDAQPLLVRSAGDERDEHRRDFARHRLDHLEELLFPARVVMGEARIEVRVAPLSLPHRVEAHCEELPVREDLELPRVHLLGPAEPVEEEYRAAMQRILEMTPVDRQDGYSREEQCESLEAHGWSNPRSLSANRPEIR
jgi:hypothetical protein